MTEQRTITGTHYDQQKERRVERVEGWRKQRRAIGRGEELQLVPSPLRGAKVGMLLGAGADIPTRVIDARILELEPGTHTSTHRHSHDAVVFVVRGKGYSLINGQRVDWEDWDALHLPSWSWHQHFNTDPNRPARLYAVTDAPLLETLRLSVVQDIGESLPPSPERPPGLIPPSAADPSLYGGELERSQRMQQENAAATLVTHWRNLPLQVNKKGTRSAFLVDPTLGFQTSGLTMVVNQIAPGCWQARHRHPGEAVLYVADGRGYSIIDEKRYEWEKGDVIIVDHFCWHQHFNADPQRVATLVRVHMWESIITTMQMCLDPMELYEEPPVLDAPDPSKVFWPEGSERAVP